MRRAIRTIFRKELVDHVRDRRSLGSAFLFPLISPLIFAVTFTLIASWESSAKPLEIAVVGRDRAPSLVQFLERSGAELSEAPKDYEQKIKDGDLEVVLVIPAEFGKDFAAGKPATVQVVQDGSNDRARKAVMRTEHLLRGYGQEIGALRLLARGVSPELAQAVKPDDVDLATKQQQGATLLNMIPLFLLMGAFIAGMHVAIDAMAGERERGSLEPLLVNPVRAQAVVLGKWLATVIAGCAGVAVMLAGFVIAVRSVRLEQLGMKVSFGLPEVLELFAVMVPLVFFTSALQMLVATFARSFREAQTYVSLVMIVPVLPGLFLSLSPVKPQDWMFWVPALGQQLLMTDVMRGDPTHALVWIGATVGACLVGAACLAITSRLLVQEKIVFGR